MTRQYESWLKKYPNSCVNRMPTLHMICVNAPKKPFCAGGAISEMYSGTMTTDAPAPTPDTSRPTAMTAMPGASASKAGPMAKNSVVSCMARRRP
jgi:enoyl-CoA hydratase/carnithine racemase